MDGIGGFSVLATEREAERMRAVEEDEVEVRGTLVVRGVSSEGRPDERLEDETLRRRTGAGGGGHDDDDQDLVGEDQGLDDDGQDLAEVGDEGEEAGRRLERPGVATEMGGGGG